MSEAQNSISAECKVPSHFVTVHGSKIHYLKQGAGEPILFIHGMPTYSYLWRNIIPPLSDMGCCIAPDLIGMGQSDKPDIDYTVFDHLSYMQGFIDALNLKNITLVMHGWGSVIGLGYAAQHEERIKRLIFYEAHIRPVLDWEMLSLPVQQLATLLNRPGASYKAIVEHNYLIRKLLPMVMLRKLSSIEMQNYEKPFLTPASRKPLWQFILELPLGQGNNKIVQFISNYSQWLQKTPIPKLMLYAIPGFVTTIDSVQWAMKYLPHLEVVELSQALHFAMESHPGEFAAILKDWMIANP